MTLLLRSVATLLGLFSAVTAQLTVTPVPDSSPIQRYLPFEIRLLHDASPYANPFWNMTVAATFTSPGGAVYTVEGFYYDVDVWMVRFLPLVEGTWSYSVNMSAQAGSYQTNGTFTCTNDPNSDFRGPVRVDPDNPERLTRDDGTFFHAIGTNQWAGDNPWINGTWAPGTTRAERWNAYFATYRAKGGNVWRRIFDNEVAWDPGTNFNGGSGIWHDEGVDQYSLPRSLAFDEELRAARANDMAVILVFLDKMKLWKTNPLSDCFGGPLSSPNGCPSILGHPSDLFSVNNSISVANHQKYYRYMIARYAVFVSVWELFNEFDETDHDGNALGMGLNVAWKSSMADFVRSKHPYHDLVCTNRVDYGSVADSWQDLHTSHFYMTHPDNEVCTGRNDCTTYDPTACARAVDDAIDDIPRFSGKPDLIDEFGPSINIPSNDPDHHRVAVWAALHRDSGLVFWDSNGWKVCSDFQGHPCGTVADTTAISDVARGYFDVCRDYADLLPNAISVAGTQPQIPTPTNALRAFGLASAADGVYSAYVHDYASHTLTRSNAQITLTNLANGDHEGVWIDPRTGNVVSAFLFSGTSLTNEVIPDFDQDIALLVRPDEDVQIVSSSIPIPSHGQPYFFRLKARGGARPYAWQVTSGSLPVGLVLDEVSGAITGTPSYGGSYQFTIQVTAQALATGTTGSSDQQAFTIQWNDTFVSNAAQDGYIIESSQGSGVGGTRYATLTNEFGLGAGDDTSNRQVLTVVSFDTSSIPDGAFIDSAEVFLYSDGANTGAIGPFFPLRLDIKTGHFGSFGALEVGDFQANATASNVASSSMFQQGSIPPPPPPHEYRLVLDSTGRNAVNKAGTTQCRIRLDDATDGDGVIDSLGFCPGEYSVASSRPKLVVKYH